MVMFLKFLLFWSQRAYFLHLLAVTVYKQCEQRGRPDPVLNNPDDLLKVAWQRPRGT